MGVDQLIAKGITAGEAERAEMAARLDVALGTKFAPALRRQRRPSLASTIKQAKRGGADRVEVDQRTGRYVIGLAGASADDNGVEHGERNEWDEVLRGIKNGKN